MQSNYFACQIYIKGGNKLSSLILVTESELYSITNKLQYKRIEIKNNEFNTIKQRWSNKYKTPRSNMVFEEWMKLLNIEIHKYRQSIKQVKVIEPIKPVKSIKPIEPVKPIENSPCKKRKQCGYHRTHRAWRGGWLHLCRQTYREDECKMHRHT